LKALTIAERNADAAQTGIEIAKDNAMTAHETTLLARESMERDLRAYVVIESVHIEKWNRVTQTW
jgi:hypothetical protein